MLTTLDGTGSLQSRPMATREVEFGRINTVLSFAKAKVTGKPYDGGENETVSLRAPG